MDFLSLIVVGSGLACLFALFAMAPRFALFVTCLPFLLFLIMIFGGK